MDNLHRYLRHRGQIPLSMLMLIIFAFFTVSIFVVLPYIGFYFHPDTGEILFFHTPNQSVLQLEDKLIKVGDVLFTEYKDNPTQPLFTSEMTPQSIVPITVKRGDTEIIVDYRMPGFNLDEFRGRLFNIWWLAYFFWIFGAVVEAFIRPRETRWRLLFSANHLTGLWILFGSFSSWHIAGGSILFHALTWLILPVYLHLNWIFPKPLFSLPKSLTILFYAIAIILFFSELIQALPKGLYALAFLIALGGSILLQIIHFIWQPEQRKQIKPLFSATLFANLPLIVLGIIAIVSGEVPSEAPIAVLALLFIPVVYFYLILRNQLGEIEIRANLFITTFAFLIIAGTLLLIVIRTSTLFSAELSALLTFVISLLSAVFSIRFFPTFRNYIEKNILGIKFDYQTLQEDFSNRIITSTSISSLVQLLEQDVFPSLFIRQYAFVQVENHHLHPLLMKNITQAQIPEKEAMQELISKSGKYLLHPSTKDDWFRLILPLKVGDSILGFFLLGQRDPDDLYHQTEIPILQAIANQTAIAFSNSLHAEQLNQMYELGVERYEEERKRLARDLHDSVLNELSSLRRNLGEHISIDIQTSYEDVIQRLREIVNDIRSPMLMYGLTPAIKALAEDLMQKTDNTLKVIVDLQTSEDRMPEKIEVHLFRVVQEAFQNSLKHAQASFIKISGSITPEKAYLLIEDDGIGFDIGETSNLGNILASGHFGLIGIVERTHVIGAKLKIESKPHAKIQVWWEAEKKVFI